ncbi:hypothetical protein EI94DRAFT_1700915 [Lactarius quietus]|nr:hypothetical protein EI94DRAFT_1700915 [Lactarius quietus]
MFNNLPGPSSIVETVVSGTKALTEKYEARYPAVFPAYHTLKKCYEKLQEIRALLDGLSEARRRKIQIASKRGACLSLEDHEGEWTRLYDQSSSFQRYFPGNHLRIDIKNDLAWGTVDSLEIIANGIELSHLLTVYPGYQYMSKSPSLLPYMHFSGKAY